MIRPKVAIQMDAPEILDKKSDSTIALIEEAIKRNYKVHIYTVDDLSLKDNSPIALCREVKSLDIRKKDFLKLSNANKRHLSTFNVILVRQDPPYNMKYLTANYILEKISGNTKVLNDPLSIRNSPEKILVTNFRELQDSASVTRLTKAFDLFPDFPIEIICNP